MNGKIIALAAFAGAAYFLFATRKGKEIREELSNATDDLAKEVGKLAEKASYSAKDLQKLISREVAGLSDDARERIAAILAEGGKSAKKLQQAAKHSLN